MLRTCTLACDVAIGWSNAANEREFRGWIEQRMAAGFCYGIIDASHTLIYNCMTKINLGVQADAIDLVIRTMGLDFLITGDISIVKIERIHRAQRMAETVQEVLDNDTIEFWRADKEVGQSKTTR
jgi:hypothetical protein